MFNAVTLVVFLAVCAVLFWQRARLGLFWSAVLFWVALVLYVIYGFSPATPSSLVTMTLGVSAVSMALYVTSSDEMMASAWDPVHRVLANQDRFWARLALLVLFPGLVAVQTLRSSIPSDVPPPKIRSVHPSPPSTIDFKGPGDTEAVTIDLVRGSNPHRSLPAEELVAKIARGKVVYYENCFFCHGDTLAADGHDAGALRPPPADFTDPGTIAMLQESYLFWRIAKGGPGLPVAGTPWDSSMPVWEDYLSEDDIWSVIDFLYDYTGYEPRAAAAHGGEH